MIKVKKIDILYSPGTTKYAEDGHFFSLPFFGVADASSAPHFGTPSTRFNGLTGGQMVKSVILDTFNSASDDLSLEDVAFEANKEIGRRQGIVASIPLNRTELLADAAFLFGKIEETSIEILQGGDCYALWVKKSGEIGITKNQAYNHEAVLVNNFAQLMISFRSDRDKAWEKHYPTLAQMNKQNANVIYATLNGQPRVKEVWQKIEIPLLDLNFLICFTDGLVHISQMKNEKKLAKDLINIFNQGGFNRVLAWTRSIENMEAEHSHQDHAEATALAIKFAN